MTEGKRRFVWGGGPHHFWCHPSYRTHKKWRLRTNPHLGRCVWANSNVRARRQETEILPQSAYRSATSAYSSRYTSTPAYDLVSNAAYTKPSRSVLTQFTSRSASERRQ